ncbi:MAG: DUF1749 domain-containing protein [Candidatus Sungiibacteriota bacterium]|uniref:DUF1749 domain-containing protein n=1 Tax=Candidatus Sungiibacteriota bacterium TaxID=2750080 RepID=A0A7T5UQE4_9BACT|nr:MAG: DUF1749 domain-containing protein [Candidatus Sungbacteria bacterium]
MIPVLLTKIKTRDGVTLDGIYVRPKKKSKIALVWIHGFSSRFYSGQTLVNELASRCRKNGIGYFKFNNRGHDIINYEALPPAGLGGSAFEKFEDCVHDIRAIVNTAQRFGYKHIFLAGHSTGTNKVLYYMYKARDRRVRGLLLLGGINDIAAEKKKLGKAFEPILKEVQKIARNKKRLDQLFPMEIFTRRGLKPEIITARRYLSLHTQGSPEDVFPYLNPRAKWKELKSVRVPLAVIIGSRDEHLDRPAKNLIEIFEKNARGTKSFSGFIIKGAKHGFQKKEKELSRTIMRWIKKV